MKKSDRAKALRLARRIESDAQAVLDLIAPSPVRADGTTVYWRDFPEDFSLADAGAVDRAIAASRALVSYLTKEA